VLAFWFPYPASFFITSLAFLGYLATRVATTSPRLTRMAQ